MFVQAVRYILSSPPVDIKLKDVKKAEKELKEREKQEREGGVEGN